MLTIGIIIGVIIGWSFRGVSIRRAFVAKYRRAVCEMNMFKKGDPRRQFWHGVENTFALSWASLMGNRADDDWHKLTGRMPS